MILCAIPQAILLAHAVAPVPSVPEGEPVTAAAVAPSPQDGAQAAEPPSAQSDGSAPAPDAPPAAKDIPDSGIVVTAREHDRADPLERVNAKSFAVTQTIDENVTAPLAHAYEHTMPKPLRSGLRNLLGNLHEPVVFVNFVLQHKIGKAAETFARFALDSTVGVAGVVDIAKRRPFNLPRRANGFGDTLGFYGVRPGAFLFLPLMGPTTVRDMVGGVLDRLLLPAVPGTPFRSPTWSVPAGAMHTLDKRIEYDAKLAQQQASDDPYAARRDYYLQQRQAEIDALRGKPVVSEPPLKTAMIAPGG